MSDKEECEPSLEQQFSEEVEYRENLKLVTDNVIAQTNFMNLFMQIASQRPYYTPVQLCKLISGMRKSKVLKKDYTFNYEGFIK